MRARFAKCHRSLRRASESTISDWKRVGSRPSTARIQTDCDWESDFDNVNREKSETNMHPSA